MTGRAHAFLGRAWQVRQDRGPQGSTDSTTKARGRSIALSGPSGTGGGRLCCPGAGAGEGRA